MEYLLSLILLNPFHLITHNFINSNNVEIDVKEFEAGIYFIEIDGSGVKFVKE